ncbi:unnamed protein product [Ambrosiozyma monospora]|uniref:Unnamed protein product n=1 Tax=Ambrosiozyma monospora TaxID=43982 RepID=A0ACB5TD71_AMBMO|nr:unnamed protein product [Ambrosiozyma monospora]
MTFDIKLSKTTIPSYVQFLSRFPLQKLTFDPRRLFGEEDYFAVKVILSKLSPNEFVLVDFYYDLPKRWASEITKVSCFYQLSMTFIAADLAKLPKLKEVHFHIDSFDKDTMDCVNSFCCDADHVEKIVLIPEGGFEVVGDDDIPNLKAVLKEFGFKLTLELTELSVKLGFLEFELFEMRNYERIIKKLELSGEVNDEHNLEFISNLKIQQLHLMENSMKDRPIINNNCQSLVISDLASIENCEFSGLAALKQSFEVDCNLDANDGWSEYVKFHEKFRLPANLVSLTCSDWMSRSKVIQTSHSKGLKKVLFKNSGSLCRNDPIWSILPTTVKIVTSGISGYDDSKFSLCHGNLVSVMRTIIAVYT